MHVSSSQHFLAMQMPTAVPCLARTPLTWCDAEVGYRQPPIENLSRLLQDAGLLRASWEAQYE